MADLSLFALGLILLLLLMTSAFFSGTETGMMASNRYRLRHLAKEKHKAAIRVLSLLERPDRLLGAILIGNTFANILAASLATVIAVRLLGEVGILVATVVLTLFVLIFSEVLPKTLAALHPERFAFIVSLPMRFILGLFYPLVISVNFIANGLLRCVGVSLKNNQGQQQLSQEELRTLVNETTYQALGSNKTMLLRLMDLKKVTVDDIMVPRNEIMGIDMADEWASIQQQLALTQHTRLPVYTDDIDSITGIVHTRSLLSFLHNEAMNKTALLSVQQEPYFVPEGTSLAIQLLNFKENKERIAFVVDEYGDVQGLVALEDILEEIVGEFTTDLAAASQDVSAEQKDGSFLVDGSANIRDINRSMDWQFSTAGPKTLNGLILEYLEAIPEPGTGCRLNGYPLEIIQIKDNAVKTVRIFPKLKAK